MSTEYPFLGASPNALVECSCCGEGVLEIKCPFKYKESTVESVVDSSIAFCLKRQSDGTFHLDYDQLLLLVSAAIVYHKSTILSLGCLV